ncbi:AAA family ATPase [Providencia rettgeri]|uniref:AAA family ATPase n=1 Tax=Providencia rettgeri TaxID=587 RepID=UPI0023625FC5|nr:AAA family ATPase [Providencia rettgeri]
MNKEFNHDKTINILIRKANKGNFYSALDLSHYYKIGRFVEKNEIESEKYLNIAYDIFKNQKIKLEEIKINNFRVFNEVNLNNFDQNLNIFIGNNGAGKTSLLDAIALSLSWLSISINKNGGTSDSIDEVDINNYSTTPISSVISEIKLNKNISATLELYQSKDGHFKTKNKLNEIKLVGGFYKIANDFNNKFNMPLLAYYNVMRSYDVNPKDLKGLDDLSENTSSDKFDAYQKSLTGKTDFRTFIKWYKRADDILIRNQINNQNKTLSALGLSEETYDLLKKLSLTDNKIKVSLDEINSILPKESDSNTIESLELNLKRNKKIIDSVISKFMDGYSNITIQIEPMIDLIITKNNRKISVMRLSQGEKTLLALVLDITRRLIFLNPSLENPLEGQGIILIDEFDLHLHPQWQKSITKNLVETFPNCQFFLTTHSAIVLGETKRQHVYILETNEQNEINIVRPNQSYGLTTNEILNEIMGPINGQQIVRNDDVETKLKSIFSLINKETKSSLIKAKKLISNLEKQLNGDIPELVKAKILLDLIEDRISDETNN